MCANYRLLHQSAPTSGCSSHTNHRYYWYMSTDTKIDRYLCHLGRYMYVYNCFCRRLLLDSKTKSQSALPGMLFHWARIWIMTCTKWWLSLRKQCCSNENSEGSFASFLATAERSSIQTGGGMHPMMVKWCVYLWHQSSKAYDTLKESGYILLPSQCTLRDYTSIIRFFHSSRLTCSL